VRNRLIVAGLFPRGKSPQIDFILSLIRGNLGTFFTLVPRVNFFRAFECSGGA
jgi:hypothetical protein